VHLFVGFGYAAERVFLDHRAHSGLGALNASVSSESFAEPE